MQEQTGTGLLRLSLDREVSFVCSVVGRELRDTINDSSGSGAGQVTAWEEVVCPVGSPRQSQCLLEQRR